MRFVISGKYFKGPLHHHQHVQVKCGVTYGAPSSEIRVFSVDEKAERGQRRSQLGGLAAGCREVGIVLQLLEGLRRA